MTYNTLFLHNNKSSNTVFSRNIQIRSHKYLEIDFFELIRQKGLSESATHIQYMVELDHINLLVVSLDYCDASLDFEFLQSLKKKYHLKIVIILLSPQNSFEYIDRYYAQIADLVMFYDTPYIDDFFNMLRIPFLKIDLEQYAPVADIDTNISLHRIQINTQNIFSSSLVYLSIKAYRNYFEHKIQKSKNVVFTQHHKEELEPKILSQKFDEMFRLLQSPSTTPKKEEVFIDKKFQKAQNIYFVYWTLYEYLKFNDLRCLLKLCTMDKLNMVWDIIKLYKTFKEYENYENILPLDIINIALYKEYTI